MRRENCLNCSGTGEVCKAYYTDDLYDKCEECLGRGYFEYPDPNDLMKVLLNENNSIGAM